MTVLAMEDVTVSVAGQVLVANASLALRPGSLTALIGPNGAGKTTLLKAALGLVAPERGTITLDDEPLARLDRAERARRIAYMPQTRHLVWPQPVRDIVALGRFAYGAASGRLSQVDERAIAEALAACHLEGFETRQADTLSGGELARVHLARALATQAPLLIADEPVAALDPRFQHEVLRVFRSTADAGRAVLSVLHDLPLALRYADRLVWMDGGRIVADGSPAETVTAERLRAVFGIEAELERSGDRVRATVLGPAR